MALNTFRNTLIASFALSVVAFAQPNATRDTQYQVRYISNLNNGDGVINITNTGANGAALPAGTSAATTGAICVNVYAFSPDEQMISCCSCPVTPNGLVSLSARRDLVNNTLTPAVPTSIVVKLLASLPLGGTTCAGSAANPVLPLPVVGGMLAWATSVHLGAPPIVVPPALPGPAQYETTETPFLPASLSPAELFRLTQLCTFINANGSGFGICSTCRLGGLGAGRL